MAEYWRPKRNKKNKTWTWKVGGIRARHFSDRVHFKGLVYTIYLSRIFLGEWQLKSSSCCIQPLQNPELRLTLSCPTIRAKLPSFFWFLFSPHMAASIKTRQMYWPPQQRKIGCDRLSLSLFFCVKPTKIKTFKTRFIVSDGWLPLKAKKQNNIGQHLVRVKKLTDGSTHVLSNMSRDWRKTGFSISKML